MEEQYESLCINVLICVPDGGHVAQVEDAPMLGNGTCLPDGDGPQPADAAQLTEEEIKKSEEDFKVCRAIALHTHPLL